LILTLRMTKLRVLVLWIPLFMDNSNICTNTHKKWKYKKRGPKSKQKWRS
jgi:hypothetical protein